MTLADGWLERAVTLSDHFDAYTTLRVAQPQPQYGTVQLNATFKGDLVSVDVNASELLAALASVMAAPDATASPYPFKDARHTARAGIAMGAAIRAGLDIVPVMDDDENWTAAFDIRIEADKLIRVVVQ